MQEKVTLVYRQNGKKIALIDGTKKQIDSITTQFENKFELGIYFRKQIKEICDDSEKKGEFIIIDEEKNEIKIIYKGYENLFYTLINDEKFLIFLEKNYEKYGLYFPDDEKYPLYDEKIKNKTIEIYRKDFKGKVKIQKEKNEEEFIGSLLENNKVKKLGGI